MNILLTLTDGRSLSATVICSTYKLWKGFHQPFVGIGVCMVEGVTHTKLMKIVDKESAGWKPNMTSALVSKNRTITFKV